MQTDTIGKIDPYALVSLGSAEFQTAVASGTSPRWKDESKEFPIEVPDSQELRLLLMVSFSYVRGFPLVMSTKISDSLTPSPFVGIWN